MMALLYHKTISLALHDILNAIGYSESNIRERIYYYNRSSLARTLSARIIQNRNDIDRIYVGSLREGIGFSSISDMDVLQIYKSVECVEKLESSMDENKVVFIVENHDTPQGYVKLKLVEKNYENSKIFEDLIVNAVMEHDGQSYLSSEKFMRVNDDMFASSNGFIGQNTCYTERKGPSLEKVVKNGWFMKYWLKSQALPEETTKDYVRGFPWFSENILYEWAERPRTNDWPCQAVLDEIRKLPVILVPVGLHGSQDEDLQWRICFPYGELRLIHSLSVSQKHVLVLLKLIAKHILRPICEGMTTYVMKNVVFWMAEKTPMDQFKPDTILDRLLDALAFLRDCVDKGMLHYYMITERNLLAGKINEKNQSELMNILTILINDGLLLIHENSGKFSDRVDTVCQMHANAHLLQRVEILICEHVTMEQLTEYFVKMFKSQTFLQAYVDEKKMLFQAVWNGGTQLMFDPLSVKFPLDEAEASIEQALQHTLMGTHVSKNGIQTKGEITDNNNKQDIVSTTELIEQNQNTDNGKDAGDSGKLSKPTTKATRMQGKNFTQKLGKEGNMTKEKGAFPSTKLTKKNRRTSKKKNRKNRWKKEVVRESDQQKKEKVLEEQSALEAAKKEKNDKVDKAFVNLLVNIFLLLYKCQDFFMILTNPYLKMMQVPLVIFTLILMAVQSFDSISLITENYIPTQSPELTYNTRRRQKRKQRHSLKHPPRCQSQHKRRMEHARYSCVGQY